MDNDYDCDDDAPLLRVSQEPLEKNAAETERMKTFSKARSVQIERSEDHNDDEAVEEKPVCSSLYYLSIVACVIGTSFQFGIALGSLNTPHEVIEAAYKFGFNDTQNVSQILSDDEVTLLWSATVSIYCVGGLIAGSMGGAIAGYLGRKGAMMWANVLPISAAVLMYTSKYSKLFELIILGRFIQGLHGGLATVVCPLYLNEISPKHLSGATGTVNQLVIVLGVVLAQVVGLSQLLGTSNNFYYILGIPVVPAVLHWILFICCPESPSWLYLVKHDLVGACQELRRLRRNHVEAELHHLHVEEIEIAKEPKVKFLDMFRTYRKRPLAIAAVMHASQQLSGINAVIFYSTSIFSNAGLGLAAAQYATLGIGGIQIIMTFVSLVVVDRLGRRTLHLYGLGCLFIFMALLSACLLLRKVVSWIAYGSIVSVALYIVAFSIGPGSIPWFYTSELFDHASRNWAISLATVVNWFCNFCVGLLFPNMQNALQDYVFLPFMALVAIFWLYLYKYAPETKGKSVLQITSTFRSIQSVLDLPSEERRHYQNFT